MARVFDIVEYPVEMRTELVHRIPESGSGDFRIGTQLIVRESQNAVFFRDGKALDTFGAGRHTLTTANIPFLVDWVGKVLFDGKKPFPAEVYFVAMREFVDQKWGTAQPILVKNSGVGLGIALLQGFGSYSFVIADAQQFVNQVVGQQGNFATNDIQDRLRAMLVSKLQDILGELGVKQGKSVLDLIGLTEEIGAAVRAKAQEDFKALGITLKSFYIESIKPSTKSAEELRAMGMLDMQTYMQLQAADAMRSAASNPSGGAGMTTGIGAGIGLGQIMGEAFKGMTQSATSKPSEPLAQVAPTLDVMTPAQAAIYLQVAEADVVAMIESGELKAKKLGSQYRIAKAAIDALLQG